MGYSTNEIEVITFKPDVVLANGLVTNRLSRKNSFGVFFLELLAKPKIESLDNYPSGFS
jgi:hypothetical protein